MAKNIENEILVVEDTTGSLDLLTEILRSEGYKVRPASDGELALRSIQAKLPSLVLLDIRMPGIDGYEVCRHLKENERTKDIPVIFLSSLSDAVDKVRGFKLGAVDYISKPYNREELLVRVHTHLELYRLRNNLEILVDERTVKLGIIADYANDWEYWLGANGHYEYVSPSCEKITGYTADEFYADPNLMERIIHSSDKIWYSNHLDEAMNERACCVLKELKIITKEGQTRHIEHNCRSIYKDTIWIGQRGSNRDVTERKQTEEKVRQSEEQFKILFEAVPVSLCFAEKNAVIKYFNNRFYQTFGYTKEDIPTLKEWWELAYPDLNYRKWVLETWGAALQKAMEQKKEIEPIEYNVTCKNGETKVVEISGIAIGEGLIATFFDVTQRREAQDALRQLNESLEKRVQEESKKSREKDYLLIKQSRSAAMGEMLSNIAHQWRQPLNALGLMIQDLKDAAQYGDLNDEYIDKMINVSMGRIQYMSQTIDDFRSFFKSDREKKVFSLLDVVHRAEHLLVAGIAVLDIKIDISIPQELNISGYENELAQVFLNIINNSKDAIVEKKIKEPKIEITARQVEKEVIITIKDNAGGIEESAIDRIFEPYFTTKEQGKGTGIGLYMTKTIIEENMGGKITARNEGDGAVFEIRLSGSLQ